MERIVYWNRSCETLLGHAAPKVLGKHCFDIIAGRDENGNRYCARNCPILPQARNDDDPVRPFTLTLLDAAGRERAIRFRTFVVPSVRAELSVVIHVVAEKGSELSATDAELASLPASAPPARWPMRAAAPVMLTAREKEIVLGFAEGLSTARVAEKLRIAPVTVRNHTQRILLKLDVHSKLAAVVFAYRHQLL